MTKKFFGEQRIHYDFIDVEMDKEGLAFVEKVNDGKQIIPTLVFEDGSTLVEPSNAELAAKLGLQTAARNTFYDLIVIGSGPAGLTAALYAAREGIDTLVIERGGVGGQAGVTERLDNFPGFPEGVTGEEFADRLRQQAERFGFEILSAQEVTGVAQDGDRVEGPRFVVGDPGEGAPALEQLQLTSLDLDHLARDARGQVRPQPTGHRGDVGRVESVEPRLIGLHVVAGDRLGEPGAGHGGDGVDSHPDALELSGEHQGERGDAGLGRRVVGLPGVAVQA